MEGGFGSDFGGSGGGKLDPGLIMEQVKVQIAVANAQELLQVRAGPGAGAEGGGVRQGAGVAAEGSRFPAENDGQVLPEVHREAGGLPGQFGAGETCAVGGRRGPGPGEGPLRVRGLTGRCGEAAARAQSAVRGRGRRSWGKPALSRAPSPPPEVHRHVHGPVHGRLEHRVPRLQLATAAGTSQHVTGTRSPRSRPISINALCEAGAGASG